jgi:polyribonucleotide nucleotidyltransferase
MFDIKRKTIEWGGRTLTLETGRMARQADGAVSRPTATPPCWPRDLRPPAQARAGLLPAHGQLPGATYAAGKIPGGYFKREGRPTEKETLTSA